MNAIREASSASNPTASSEDPAGDQALPAVIPVKTALVPGAHHEATPDETAGDTTTVPENRRKTAMDEQTGRTFAIERENALGVAMAILSGTYLIGCLLFFLWLLLDTWSGRNALLMYMGYEKNVLASGTFRLLAFVAIGGALGATVDGIRALILWHAERQAFGPRFIWKDLSLPLIGATVALFVYTALRGGVGVLNGDFSLSSEGSAPVVTAFAIAAVTGFSSWQVFRWLDAQANRLFSLAKSGLPGNQDSSAKSGSDAQALQPRSPP